MKLTITILSFFVFTICEAQGIKNVVFEKFYHPNGKTHIECEYDTVLNAFSGMYREFDTIGNLLVEGKYRIVDSVKCKDCFEGYFSRQNEKSDWMKYEYYDLRNLRIGEWKYFYSNGNVKMKGSYSDQIHVYFGESNLKDKDINGPYNSWVKHDFLKNGRWEYFNDNGDKIKIEENIDGALIYVVD